MSSLQPNTNGLHVIIDVNVAARAGWTPVDLATACLEGGARVIQLRAKALAGGTFLELASQLHHLTLSGGGVLIVNDRADIARLADAEGVHVGQEDLSPAAARAILGTDAVVGLSTHTEQQIGRAVLEPISYVAIGPVFETSTKATGYAAVGLDAVKHAATLAEPRGLGLIAIGGITLGRTRDVLRAGATGVAVITDLLDGNDPEARTRAYVSEFASRGKV
jgi:thiamine-phosphate pyrophosphorylase